MGRAYTKSVAVGVVNALFRPGEFVAANTTSGGGVLRQRLRHSGFLMGVYLLNLLLYAGPLTLAGYGVGETVAAPGSFASVVAPFADPATAWTFATGFVQNSAFITALSGLTFVTYHVAVVGTLNSKGYNLTLHTVVYSASAYLAGIFSLVVFLSEQRGFDAAREVVLELQIRFITVFYEALGVPPAQRVFTPSETIPFASVTPKESLVLAVLVVLVLYFAYSLYLGARLNHRASRFGALLALAGVVLSPAIYVSALILWSTAPVPA